VPHTVAAVAEYTWRVGGLVRVPSDPATIEKTLTGDRVLHPNELRRP
jgi:hypothetical protein